MAEFVDGLFIDRREKAPDFVKANLSFNVKKFTEYLESKANDRGYVNIDLKESREGKLYASLNDWKPTQVQEDLPAGHCEDLQEEVGSEIPF